jgi:sucrose phosphorylase
MENNGGKITYRTTNSDVDEPYEINISLFDAMRETFSKEKKLFMERYICIHTIMMSLEGVPAFYIHSLFGTENDYDLYEKTGHNRSLNRSKIDSEKINIDDNTSKESKIYNKLKELLLLRRMQAAFHPNALQFTLHLGNELYGIWRQSMDKKQSIFCITNVTDRIVSLSLLDINLDDSEKWYDLISQDSLDDIISSIDLKPYQTVWLSNK